MFSKLMNKIKDRRLFFVWIASYIAIIIIAILINLIGYRETIKITTQEIFETNQKLVLQVKNLYDNIFSTLESNAYKLLNSQSVINMTTQNTYINDEQNEWIKNIITDVSLYRGNNDTISNIQVVFKNIDVCIDGSSKFDKQILYDMFYSDYYSTKEACLNDLFIKNLKQYKVISDKNGNQKILLIYSYPTVSNEKNVIVITEINAESIEKNLKKNTVSENSQFFLLNNKDEIVISTDKTNAYNFSLDSNLYKEEKISGEKYVFNYLDSQKFPGKYLHIIKNSEYTKKVNNIKNIFLLSYLLCIIIGLFLAYIFSKFNYKPLKKIVNTLSNENKTEFKGSEFMYIEKVMNDVFEEKKMIEEKVTTQNSALKNTFLSKLISGKLNFNNIKQQLKEYEINLDDKYVVVCLFNIMELGLVEDNDGKLDWKGYNTAHFVINNVFSELLCDFGKVYFCEIDDMYACVVNFPKNKGYENGYIASKAKYANEFLNKHLGLNLVCAISQTSEDLLNIPTLFNQAMDIISYRFILSDKHILVYDDIVKNTQAYEFNVDMQNSLVNTLTLGDEEKTIEIIEKIVSINLKTKNINIDMLRILIAELITCILKSSISIDKDNTLNTIEFCKLYNDLVDMTMINEILSKMYDFVREICAIAEKEKQNLVDSRCENIKNYIKNNYADPNLSVSAIADVYNLSLNYLSKYFKSQTGEGLADYIVRYRVLVAKKLLKETNKTIVQIAGEVGFYSSNVFIRAFKKTQGITPNVFKLSQPPSETQNPS